MLGSDTDHFKTDPPCLLIIFCTNNFYSKINMMSTALVIFNSRNEEYLYLILHLCTLRLIYIWPLWFGTGVDKIIEV